MAQLNRSGRSGWVRIIARRTSLVIVLGLAWAAMAELQTSQLQAAVFSWFAHDMTFWLEPGANPTARFPSGGPYNERLGYARLPSFIDSLIPIIDRDHVTLARVAQNPSRIELLIWTGEPDTSCQRE